MEPPGDVIRLGGVVEGGANTVVGVGEVLQNNSLSVNKLDTRSSIFVNPLNEKLQFPSNYYCCMYSV